MPGANRQYPQPRPLQSPVWDRLIPHGFPRRVPRDNLLYRQGEPAPCCYYVHSGRIKAVILRPDGTEKILEVLGPGSLLGEAAAFDGLPHYSTCIALDPAAVVAFPAAVLLERMQADAEVARHLMRVLARKQRVLARQVEDLTFRSTAARIARLLGRLLDDYGVPAAGGRLIALRLTHEQLAGITGTTRVSVTRALSRLRQQGVLAPAPAGWLVQDEARLRAAADAAP